MKRPEGTSWIRGEWGGPKVTSITSSITKGVSKVDYITQGVKPSGEGNVVIASWQGVPLAFWDIPTLNNMNFSKKLWQDLRNDERISRFIESGCFWGEPSHADREEIYFPDVSHRVTDFWIDSSNIVRGNIDLIDTPNGFTCYKLSSVGAIGNSSRGWGNLVQSGLGHGIKDVDQSSYFHVCWDLVAVPAVPACLMTLASDLKRSKDAYPGMVESLRSSESAFTRELRGLLQEMLGKTYSLPGTQKLASSEERVPEKEVGNPPGGEPSGAGLEEHKEAAKDSIVDKDGGDAKPEEVFDGSTNTAKKEGEASEIKGTPLAPSVAAVEKKVYELNLYNSIKRKHRS